MFQKASKAQAKLRLALSGASGSGKTRSALEIGKYLGKRIALVDTEFGSASKYADIVDFDVCEVRDDYSPLKLVEILKVAAVDHDVVVIDSMTHFWNGPGGFLDLVDKEAKRASARNGKFDSFAAWKEVTPVYNRMVQAILGCPAHVIITMRAKQEYSKEGGKVTKLGTAPEMRDNFQYEMDIEGLLDENHNLVIGKTRCDVLDRKVFAKPGKEVADLLLGWLNSGAVPPERVEPSVLPAVTTIVSVGEFQELTTSMMAVTTLVELAEVVKKATTASKEKRITQAEFDELGKVYMHVKKGLS